MDNTGGTPDEHDATLGPGTRLGKYEIGRLLGAGGMGAVYEATHTDIGKRVAIKVLSAAIAATPGVRARFLREAQLTSSLRHPHIVDVTDMGSEGGQTYLVMEFLRGEDLAQRLARTGPLPPRDLADIMLPVCSAVIEAHKAGITHRDLKPQNIFLAEGPHGMQPKVLDFGISKGNDVGAGSLTGTGAMIGTPYYLAPEQIMDTRSSGPQSDQYALGVILYECLTGSRPFEDENLFVVFQAIVAGKPMPPRQRRSDISPELEAIVLRAMNVDPKARFGSTIAVGRSLLPFASPRMQSIWEDAFASVSDEDARAPLYVQPQQPPPAALTPPGTTSPFAGAKGAIGIQTPAVGSTRAFPAPAHPLDDQNTLDIGAGRSRTRRRAVFLGVVVVGAAITAAVALRPGPEAQMPAPALKTPVAAEKAPTVPLGKPPEAAPVLPPAGSNALPHVPAEASPPFDAQATPPAVVSPPRRVKSERPVRPPTEETAQETAREPIKDPPAHRPRPPKNAESRSLNPNGAPVID